jgi:TctA family transporter
VSGTAVLLLSALTIQGLVPGPSLTRNSPELLDASVAGLLGGTIILLLTGWWLSRGMMRVVAINRSMVIILMLAVIVLGVFALSRQMFDVGVCLACGVIGYFMMRYGYSVAAAALAAILSAEFERTLRTRAQPVRQRGFPVRQPADHSDGSACFNRDPDIWRLAHSPESGHSIRRVSLRNDRRANGTAMAG